MLNITQFRQLLVKSTLNDLLMYSPDAEELLVFTCANESLGGTYLHQIDGPALGIYQIEPASYTDLWDNYISSDSKILLPLVTNFHIPTMPSPERMIYDLRFATAMARIYYHRVKEPLPAFNDINAIWTYYKTFYNTSKGDAHMQEAISNYEKFIRN